MQREDLGNGVEYVSRPFPGFGQVRRKLTEADLKRLRSYLASAPEQEGMSGLERWILYSLAWGVDGTTLTDLRWADIDFARQEMHTGKGVVPISNDICQELTRLKTARDARSEEPVFGAFQTQENPGVVFSRMLDSDCRKAHLSVWPTRATE